MIRTGDTYICIKYCLRHMIAVGELIVIHSTDIDPECGLEFARYVRPANNKMDYLFMDDIDNFFIKFPKVRPNDIWESLNE